MTNRGGLCVELLTLTLESGRVSAEVRLPLQVGADGLTGECVHLQIHSFTQFRTRATGRSCTVKVSASSTRRPTDQTAR